MCNACKTYKRILGLCGKFWYLLSAVRIVFFIDNPYPALADLGNSAAGDDQLALVLAGLDLNNRPVQILDEPHSLLRCHDVALIQAVLPVLVDQNHFHQNFVLAVLVVHLNIAVLQAIFTPIFFDDYPFTPPRVKPLAKYFWKNGKAIISGSTPIKAIAMRTDSCGIVNCPSSAANSGLLAINSIC